MMLIKMTKPPLLDINSPAIIVTVGGNLATTLFYSRDIISTVGSV